MKYLFLDFETKMTKELRLNKMTTRAYCAQTEVTMLAWALDNEPVQHCLGEPEDETLEYLRSMAASDDVCFVAFNASFDLRVLHINLGIPYPQHFLCALELARCAWPNQPGGYSLDNLAIQLGLKYQKLKVDLASVRGQELIDYCKSDVEVLREIFNIEKVKVAPEEFRVCELSNRAKTIYFEVDTGRVLEAVENMSRMAGDAALAVAHAFDDDPEILKAFGWHGDEAPDSMETARKMIPKSVKPDAIKRILLDRLCIDFIGPKKSMSIKKINPAELAAMPDQAQKLLTKSSDLNKALSYRRGLAKFSAIDIVDCELSYAAAHTLRFASRNEGSKGLNLHNCFESGTLVLTSRGWIAIKDIDSTDTVWNGSRFVPHGGLKYEGKRKCLETLGTLVTQEHPIWTGYRMVPVGQSTRSQRALCLVAGSLSRLQSVLPASLRLPAVPAAAEALSARTTSTTLEGVDLAEVFAAQNSLTSFLADLCEPSIVAAIKTCLTGSGHKVIPTSASSQNTWFRSGSRLSDLSNTVKDLMDGITEIWRWIGSTEQNLTDRGTYVSLLHARMELIGEPLSVSAAYLSKDMQSYTGSLISVRTTSSEQDVWDLLDCGKFQAGPILASNCPKHNKLIAEPFRRSFRLPEGKVWVRGDFANVEYRGEGLITNCAYIKDLFTLSPFSDPYTSFGEWATGLTIDKNTPAGKALRQLFKAAVLGLGYMMKLTTWMTQLLQVLARGDASIDDFIKLAAEKRWSRCSRWAKSVVKRLGCHEIIGIVGENIHELFHQRHPEFAKFGRWLEAAVSRLSYAHNPQSVIDELMQLPGSPNPDMFKMWVDRSLGGSSVRVSTAGWPASVCWRDLAIRETLRGACLTSVLAGHKPPRAITPSVLIENVVQYWARTALVKGQLKLEALGHDIQLSIHDEVFMLADADGDSILRARQDMLAVFGPGNDLGFGWAILIDPASITVSKSLWDDEKWCQSVFWPRLTAGDDSVIAEIT